jgi:hypothetical protein
MIDAQEQAVCARRGHSTYATPQWQRCKYCGLWYREVRTLEESPHAPPESEQDPRERLKQIHGDG